MRRITDDAALDALIRHQDFVVVTVDDVERLPTPFGHEPLSQVTLSVRTRDDGEARPMRLTGTREEFRKLMTLCRDLDKRLQLDQRRQHRRLRRRDR